MTAIDRDRAPEAFKTYTDAYDAANPRIALKIEHTYHVAETCDAVAREQGWAPEDIDLAWLCGLLHDMGRLEQLRRWDTFKDAESMSHAALGVEVLDAQHDAPAPAFGAEPRQQAAGQIAQMQPPAGAGGEPPDDSAHRPSFHSPSFGWKMGVL